MENMKFCSLFDELLVPFQVIEKSISLVDSQTAE